MLDRKFVHVTSGVGVLALLLPFLHVDLNGDVGPCNTLGKMYVPLDLPGVARSVETSWEKCRTRCHGTIGCVYFNFWPGDGGCHVSGAEAVAKDADVSVVAGPQSCHDSGMNVTGLAVQASDAKSALELWRIDGAYYDFSALLDGGHPGGALPLVQTRGTDVSLLFRVQHLGDRPRLALDKYLVREQVKHGDLVDSSMEFSFDPNGFYETVKGRVRTFLKDTIGEKSPRKATSAYLAKLGINVVLFFGSWYRVLLYPLDIPTYAACLVNAVSRMVLTGQAHDAIHGILMPTFPTLQSAFASAIFRGFLNFRSDKWHDEHVIFHHPYTKTTIDPDENLHQGIPVWRLTNATEWNPKHTWPLTSQIGIGAIFPLANGAMSLPKLVSPYALERLDGFAALATIMLLHLLPLAIRPRRDGIKIVALTSMLAACVTLLGFHMSHLGDHLEMPFQPGIDWGEHQMRTSTNFISYIGGTIDLQIEHHLFPMLSYENQQAVSPIVRETAREFGIPYNCYGSATQGIFNHLSYMVDLGLGEQLASSSPNATRMVVESA